MSKRILIADDSASMRQLITFSLKDAGYEVIAAADGAEALEKLKSERVNLIVTDLNMPKMDGISLIRAVRKSLGGRFTPIVMLTTESMPAKKQEGREAGATGWIVKPFKPEQLIAVVKKVIR